MRAHSLTVHELIKQGKDGWIVAEDIRSTRGRRIIKKGAVLDRSAFESLSQADDDIVHVVEPDFDDLHEDEAGRRLTEAIAGDGIRIKGPALSRYHLVADRKGVLRIDPQLIFSVNQISGLSVFTLLDRQVVLPGKIVAGVKVTPLTVPERDIERAEHLIQGEGGPAICVTSFQHKQVAVIATEGLSEKLRDRFSQSVEQKIHWYGSTVSEIRFVASDPDAVTDALRELTVC